MMVKLAMIKEQIVLSKSEHRILYLPTPDENMFVMQVTSVFLLGVFVLPKRRKEVAE